jgi:predicted permease
MSFVDAVRYRVRALLRPGAFARERDEEIRHHFDLEKLDIARSNTAGTSADDVEWHARRRFGNVTYIREERRMIAGLSVFDAARQDIRFLSRLLRRRAAFAIVTVLTIALGIGAATSIFSVADAVLFRPLAFAHPDRVISVWLTRPRWKTIPGQDKRWDRGTLSYPMFLEWRRRQQAFDDVAVWTSGTGVVGGRTSPEEMIVGEASASLLRVLGVHPALGSWFAESDNTTGGARVAVVSYETWVAQFGADPHVLGRLVDIDTVRREIIGVMPRGFSLDRGPTSIAYWIPTGTDSTEAERSSYLFQALGRLKLTVSLSAASAETSQILRAVSDDDRVEGALVTTLHADQTRAVRRPLLILLAAATLLLVIACINVATLLMGEAVTRDAELRTRTALGASRGRLLAQLLTESVTLSGIGAAAGTTMAFAATKLIVRAAPPSIPGLADVHLDVRVLAVALSAALCAGILFGLAPAVTLVRSTRSLGAGGAGNTASGRARAQRTLIACEVALSMVLLIAGGLLVRSFSKLSSVGFQPAHVLVVTPRVAWSAYTDSVRTRAFVDGLTHRLQSLPGVVSTSVTTTPPFSNGSSTSSFDVEGRQQGVGTSRPSAQRRATSPDFFAMAGIPVLHGRAYGESDRANAPLVVVVNEAMAQREWPHESPIGKRIKYAGAWRTVIGVVGNIATERPSADPPETIYVPFAQLMLRGIPSILLRTGDGRDVDAAEIRRAVKDVESDASVRRVEAMPDLIAASLADDRLRTTLISVFAAIAAVLAAIGTYGVAAASASRRTREMAIRMAVGASHGSVARLIVGGAAKGVAVGAAAGVVLAWIGTRALAPYLFGVGATDPAVYSVVAVLLAITTLCATWVPARRAMRVRLVETLTSE